MSDSFEKMIMRLQNGNDVRGAAIAANGEALTLTPGICQFISAAFLGFLSRKTGKAESDLRVGVGHDSRVTADKIKSAVIKGFSAAHVYDCHLISTPAMFQSTVLPASNFDGAVMITASHLPFNRNGLKFFTKDGGLEHAELTEVLRNAVALAGKYGKEDTEELISAAAMPLGSNAAEDFDMVTVYCDQMKKIIKEEVNAEDFEHPLKGLHIVEDAGNGAAGFFASEILEPLGADISGSVFLDPDGSFPNHIPNPENKDAMNAARKATVDHHADLGVIFDCDGDRGAVVFADGTEVNRNVLIGLLSAIISEKHPGSTVVTDSVTSDELADFLENRLGMKHYRYKRGYKNVIDKGIELNRAGTDCQLAIETSGHGAFKENYFSDDGAYIAVKIICKMAVLRKNGERIESLIADLKSPAESVEVRFKIAGEDFGPYGARVLDDFTAFAESDDRFHIVEPNYEGIRISFDDSEVKGWMLLRKSLHDPVLPMNVEAEQAGGTDIIMKRVSPFFEKYDRLSR
ncbi:MAG: phosphomannomutase/phosphoglucomutase [Lachnospiraceae bacterium]|nr:phosphomannomutase/phosphoglucomutase [Lachnospiraceae bacterium]